VEIRLDKQLYIMVSRAGSRLIQHLQLISGRSMASRTLLILDGSKLRDNQAIQSTLLVSLVVPIQSVNFHTICL
jgi:hypothetical protein